MNITLFSQEHDQLSDIRLIDFQLCRSGSVVNDISYLIYSGVTKDILDSLDYFLKIYHDSFSNTLRAFDLEPSEIFSYEDFVVEWKAYCSFGFLLAPPIWTTKLAGSYEKKNLVELNDNIRTENRGTVSQDSNLEDQGQDQKKLREVFSNLVLHMFDRSYL